MNALFPNKTNPNNISMTLVLLISTEVFSIFVIQNQHLFR